MVTTLASTAPRTNVYAANTLKPRRGLVQSRIAPVAHGARPLPPPAVSSMDLPNRAGQPGPVPMRGIVNSQIQKRSR